MGTLGFPVLHMLKSKGILMGTLGFPVIHKLKSKGILMGTLGFRLLSTLCRSPEKPILKEIPFNLTILLFLQKFKGNPLKTFPQLQFSKEISLKISSM